MRIGELAALTGVSARSLRHYESQHLLIPERQANGYREYAATDIARVVQIAAMIAAGLNTATIRRYLDCAQSGTQGTSLRMCPDLRAELDALAERLDSQQLELSETRRRLVALGSVN